MQKVDGQRPPEAPNHRIAGAAILGASLIAIGWLTLAPAAVTRSLPPFCLICGPLGGVDFVLNVALFVPLGVGVMLLGRPARQVLLAGVLTTLLIEGLQWRIIPGRDASLGDLLANTIGAVLGGWLVPRVASWSRTGGRPALPLVRAAGVISTAAIALASFLLIPAPPAYPQWVLWTASRPHLDPFPDTLRAVSLNGRDVRGGDVLQPGFLFAGVTHSTTVTAIASGPGRVTRRQAHIVAAANPEQEGLFLGQWGNGLIFRTYLAGSRLRLRPLLARLDHAFGPDSAPAKPDPIVRIDARSDRRAIVLTRVRGADRLEATLPRTVGLAWTLVLPWDVAIDTSWWLANALFLGALVVPVTFLATRARQGRVPDEAAVWEAWWPLALVLGGMAAFPGLAGLSPLGAREWAGALAVGAVGALLARLTRPGVRP